MLYLYNCYIEKNNPKGTQHLKGKKLDPIQLNLMLYITDSGIFFGTVNSTFWDNNPESKALNHLEFLNQRKMPRGTLEVVLISAKGLEDNDFLCK